MKSFRTVLFIPLFLWLAGLYAQPNPGHEEILRRFSQAENYFQHHNLDLAYEAFTRLKKELQDDFLLPDIDYYLTVIEIYEGEPYAEDKIREYLLRYPYSPYRDRLRLLLIDRKFAAGKFQEVQRLIDRTEIYNLPPEERERLRFYEAYIALKNNDLSKARKLFKELENSSVYGDQAVYYLGYIAYLKNNIAEAQRYFERVNNKNFTRTIPYYNADMYYRAGHFEKAIEEALKIYPKSRGKERSELAKIIGSSYFNLGQYDKAIPYLEAYGGKNGRWTPKDYYELGYAYYKAGDCEKAINYFNKIIDTDNALAQNAYYHLGKCYLETGNKTEALNAFKKVSEMNYDLDMQKDAAYEYIKLSYEIGNPYEPLNKIIEDYLEKYPDTPHRDELQNLLINSYITSRNYAAALEAMQQNGLTNRPEFQKVALLRGLELFNEGKYDDAVRMFDLSLKYGLDPDDRNRAVFWKAEALYRMGRYVDALTEYKSLESDVDRLPPYERRLYDYNLGYVYFKLKDYDRAARYFARYVNGSPDPKLLKDAYLRLGDSYFASRKYWPAMDAYNQAIRMAGHNADYAFYQKAISYGFVGKTDRKIEELQEFLRRYPQSKLADDALYQLGSTYLNLEKYDEAAATFRRLLDQYPDSPYVPVSMLKLGLAYYNKGDNRRAKEVFQNLIKTYPRTPEAAEAAGYLKDIYIDENDPDGFLTFINQIPGFDVQSNELEQEIFRAAETKYFEQNYAGARAAFASYLERFPDGIYATDATHYLAKIYVKLNEPEKAYAYYEKLAQMPPNPYTVEALRFLALENLKKGNNDEAAKWLKKLAETAQTDDDLLFAASNLMRIYEKKGDLTAAAEYARRVLENPKHDKVMEIEAQRILARLAVENGDWDEAEKLYEQLAREATGETAAEALYFKAYILHRKGEYDASNEVVAELSKKYPSYKYWSGKALIVMAKNMYAKGDVFNATYILENVIDRFEDYPEITDEARQVLQEIKNQTAKENSNDENNPDEK